MFFLLKNFRRLWRSAKKDMSRHFSVVFSSAASIAIALTIATIMSIATIAVDEFSKTMEDTFMLQVSLAPSITEEQKADLQNEIEGIKGVKSVSYFSKEVEMDQLIEQSNGKFSQYSGNNNPLYDIFSVDLNSIDQADAVMKSIEKLNGVISIDYGGGIVLSLMRFFSSARIIAYVIVAAMIVLSFFLIRSSVRLSISTRSNEIAIMRQVGATNGYILTPFILEGMTIGFIGGLVPSILLICLYPFFYKAVLGLTDLSALTMPAAWPFCGYASCFIILVGMLVGMTGAYSGAHKYLKGTR